MHLQRRYFLQQIGLSVWKRRPAIPSETVSLPAASPLWIVFADDGSFELSDEENELVTRVALSMQLNIDSWSLMSCSQASAFLSSASAPKWLWAVELPNDSSLLSQLTDKYTSVRLLSSCSLPQLLRSRVEKARLWQQICGVQEDGDD